jgi:hypothetical protein
MATSPPIDKPEGIMRCERIDKNSVTLAQNPHSTKKFLQNLFLSNIHVQGNFLSGKAANLIRARNPTDNNRP